MIRAYSAEAIRAAEAPLLEAGVPLMRDAARAIVVAVVRHLKDRSCRVSGSVVTALVGGGNNGGDALYAAAELSRRGAQVFAVLTSTSVHTEGLDAAAAAGVRTVSPADALTVARKSGVWIDGLAGIGAQPPLREPIASLVADLNAEADASPERPIIIAVDVPSGLGDGSRGQDSSDGGADLGPVLRATETITMGAAKPSLLMPHGATLAGKVTVVELGLDFSSHDVRAARLNDHDVADLYPFPHRDDHKYTRGVVGLWTGSDEYPGAGILSVGGALASGVGMVRAFGTHDVVRAHPEVVAVDGRIQAAVVGSGMVDAGAAFDAAQEHDAIIIADAGAITHARDGGAHVMTPHAGELAELLGVERAVVEREPLAHARAAAQRTGAVVVLKGNVSLVVPPEGIIYSQQSPTSWLATAGSGDVLAGLMGGLVALAAAREQLTTDQIARITAAAVWIHAQAGADCGDGPLTASRIAEAIPHVIARLPR